MDKPPKEIEGVQHTQGAGASPLQSTAPQQQIARSAPTTSSTSGALPRSDDYVADAEVAEPETNDTQSNPLADGLRHYIDGSETQAHSPRPFFSRFLRRQPGHKPPGAVTQKYPSDEEDGGHKPPGAVTQKYPSDEEDGGHKPPGAVTQKYPSDEEDGGHSYPIDPGGFSTTMKYPSDGEDGGGGGISHTMKYPSDNEEGGFTI